MILEVSAVFRKMGEQINFDPLVQSSTRSRRMRPWIGVNLTAANTFYPVYGKRSGPVIRKVATESPAARAGLRAKDILLKVDDLQIETPEKFQKYLWNRSVGETISVLVRRNGKEHVFEVKIESEFSDAETDE